MNFFREDSINDVALQKAYSRNCANFQDNPSSGTSRGPQSGPSKGTIAGGVVGGLAGIAAIGVVGAIIFHSTVAPIPGLAKLGIFGAGAGASAAVGGAASTGGTHSAGTMGTGAAHAGQSGHVGRGAHSGHAVDGSHAAHAVHGANTNSAVCTTGDGTAVGSASPGTGPAFAPDGGVGHAVGAGQPPFGIYPDGGISQAGPDIVGGQGAIGGPSFPGHGAASAPFGVDPTGPGMAPNAASSSPAATVPYAPPSVVRLDQTKKWSWLGRSRKEVEREEAQRKENERLILAGQMVQVPILGAVSMGAHLATDAGPGGGAGGLSFPVGVTLQSPATNPNTSARAFPSTLNSPNLTSGAIVSNYSSLSVNSQPASHGFPTPSLASQSVPLLTVEPPHNAGVDANTLRQDIILPSKIEYSRVSLSATEGVDYCRFGTLILGHTFASFLLCLGGLDAEERNYLP
ncbi:hypothetical protein DL93DRAFT_2101197 [Clavulina sp. PMI_390]|nr:hypothetical protein DL93DRAFT_2101197 [Clavulina sp. PMI_390]